MKGFDSKFKDIPDYILKITYQIWENQDVESIREYYGDVPNISFLDQVAQYHLAPSIRILERKRFQK